jgi:SHS2 domain-containing protein
MSGGGYRYTDHTADVGMRVEGESLEALFAYAALGLLAYTVVNLDRLAPAEHVAVEMTAPSDAELLVDWLNERLFLFDARGEIHAWPELDRVGDGRLVGKSGYRAVDFDRMTFGPEVKSVTYHGLSVERRDALWIAEVIFDL